MFKTRFAAAAAIALAAASFVATLDTADARVRRGAAAVHTQHGTAAGRSEVRRERGHRSRDTTWTAPNGAQRSTSDDRTWDRRAGTYNRDRDTTYRDGSTRSVDVDAQRTAPGEAVVQREVTGRNGQTRTQTGVFNAERTENGRVVNGDITTTNAGHVDYSREVTREGGVRSVDSRATFEDGTSVSRSSVGACADGTCSSSTALTNRQGATTTIDRSRTRTDAGAVYSRDTTFSDGSTRSVDRERVGNGDGTGEITRTVTGRDGETRTQTGEYEVTREP
jgi:hypothetical protein